MPAPTGGLTATEAHLARVAAQALRLAAEERAAQAAALITATIGEHGWEAANSMLMTWPLMMQLSCYPRTIGHPELVGSIAPLNTDTGEENTLGELPAPVAWAANWVHALLTRDQERADTLWTELSTEHEDIGPHLDAVLTATSGLIRRREAGLPL